MATYNKGITRVFGGWLEEEQTEGRLGSQETESARTFLLVTARGATTQPYALRDNRRK